MPSTTARPPRAGSKKGPGRHKRALRAGQLGQGEKMICHRPKLHLCWRGLSSAAVFAALALAAHAQTVTATVSAGSLPFSVAVNPATNNVYVTNYDSNTVTVIDGANNSTTTVAVGSNPSSVAVNPVTNKIYVANFGGNTVTV